MMDPELKAKWTAELRSGKYKQGAGRLRKLVEDGTWVFCCLGVLAEVLGLELTENGYRLPDGSETDRVLRDPSTGDALFGLTDKQHCDLTFRNDCRKYSFAEIADYIESPAFEALCEW